MAAWCSGYQYCTTSFNQAWLRFCAGSNPACGMSEICDGKGSLTMVPAGNKTNRLSLVNHTRKTIHHHHHYYYYYYYYYYNYYYYYYNNDNLPTFVNYPSIYNIQWFCFKCIKKWLWINFPMKRASQNFKNYSSQILFMSVCDVSKHHSVSPSCSDCPWTNGC